MNDRQRNAYNAGVSGQAALDRNNTVFTTPVNTPLDDLRLELKNNLGDIEQAQEDQLRKLGLEAKLIQDLSIMQTDAWPIRNLAFEYAKKWGGTEMEHAVHFNKTDFNNGGIAQRCNNVQALIDALPASVITAMIAKGYLITPAMVAALQTDVDNVRADFGAPQGDIARSTAATKELAEVLFVKLKQTIESIKNIVQPYYAANREVVNEVLDAFEIDDIARRHRAVRIILSDRITHARLKGVVTFDTGLIKKFSKRGISDSSHQELHEGNVGGTITCPGFTPYPFSNWGIFDAKYLVMKIDMDKIV